MSANYVLLEKITVGAAGAASVTFSNIPQTGYTDLVIKASPRSAATGNPWDSVAVEFNGSSATAYTIKMLYGDGTTPSSASSTSSAIIWSYFSNSSTTANTFGSIEMYIPNYTGATYKSMSSDSSSENKATQNLMALTGGLWSNTAAVTSIKLTPTSATNFSQYSTFYLYGVAKLGTTPTIQAYATGGDIIETDGTYWYHAFLASGIFTPAKGLSCDVLIVAGGGGGGGGISTNANGGGGGGAGGLVYSTGNSVSSAQTVTVGSGGAGGNTSTGVGANGVNSVFGSLTAAVGGGGGGAEGALNNGFNGRGSNGGSGGGNSQNQSVPTGTIGQGNNGGNNTAGASGGGGGAGAVGGNNDGSTPGPGGAGVNTYSAFLSVTGLGVSGYIAGGGGGGKYNAGAGGAGGAGGGGTGGSGGADDDTAGTANTGSGGGGSSNQAAARSGSAGGSGLVIVRYLI
jgi:hypothetical protein